LVELLIMVKRTYSCSERFVPPTAGGNGSTRWETIAERPAATAITPTMPLAMKNISPATLPR
jgi:hypothetical protein